jgi:hypothetical protein
MKHQILGLDFSKKLPKPIEEVDYTRGFMKWGKKNDYPFFINELLESSPTHGGILKNKIRYISGLGVEAVSGDVTDFLANKYTDYDMSEVVDMIVADFEIYNGIVVKGTWDKAGQKVVMWEHIDFDNCRFSEDGMTCYISDDWDAQIQSPDKTNYREVPVYSASNKTGSFFIYIKENSKKLKKEKGIYPKPTYSSGIMAINTEANINKYNNALLENGFTTGTLIVFNDGKPESEEEGRKLKDKFINDTGPENAGAVRVTFADGKDKSVEVHNLNGNDLDKRFDLTNKTSVENIVKAHQVFYSPLFGLKPEGSFNAAESADLFNIFYVTYVEPRQKRLNWLLNYMIELSGYVGEVQIKGVNPVERATAQPTGLSSQKKKCCNFEHEDFDADVVLKYGEPQENFEVIDEMEIEWGTELESLTMKFDAIADISLELTDKDKTILSYLKDKNDSTSIGEATKLSILEIAKAIARMTELGLINKEGQPSKLAERLLDREGDVIERYELRYVYDLKRGVPDVKTSSREFCVKLVDAKKSYSREDINAMTNDFGNSVFTYRGGWYTNPDTGETTPYCRHVWKQQLTVRK